MFACMKPGASQAVVDGSPSFWQVPLLIFARPSSAMPASESPGIRCPGAKLEVKTIGSVAVPIATSLPSRLEISAAGLFASPLPKIARSGGDGQRRVATDGDQTVEDVGLARPGGVGRDVGVGRDGLASRPGRTPPPNRRRHRCRRIPVVPAVPVVPADTGRPGRAGRPRGAPVAAAPRLCRTDQQGNGAGPRDECSQLEGALHCSSITHDLFPLLVFNDWLNSRKQIPSKRSFRAQLLGDQASLLQDPVLQTGGCGPGASGSSVLATPQLPDQVERVERLLHHVRQISGRRYEFPRR